MVGWTGIALAAEKGALLGSLLGCFSGVVAIFQKFREEATVAPQATGPAAPLKRLRPCLGSVEVKGPLRPPSVNREPSMRLLGDQAAAQRPKWQVVRQELADTAFLLLFARLAYEAKCGHLHSEHGKPAKESKAATLVEDELACFDGHPLQIESIQFSPGRTHLKVTYPGTGAGTTAFVCNFDLPCCNPNTTTTRCLPCSVPDSGLSPGGLGHAALLVLLLCELGRSQPRLTRSIVCIFLAEHRHGEGGCADLLDKGHLNELRGPVYWLDGAASPLKEWWNAGVPCVCTGALGSLSWMLRVRSDANPVTPSVELAAQAVASMQASFAKDFTAPQVPGAPGASVDGTYLRCTRMETQEKNLQHSETHVHGLIRLTPCQPIRITQVLAAVEEYVSEVNARVPRRLPGQPPTLRRSVTNDDDEAVVKARRRRSQRERSPPRLPAQAPLASGPLGIPGGISMDLIWAQRLTQGKERRLLSWSQKALSAPHTPKRRAVSTVTAGEELALDLEGVSTRSDSLARLALEEALWEFSAMRKTKPSPVFRHFMVHGSVPHARRVQEAGGDVQLLGFLQPKAEDNEELNEDSCSLDGMRYGYKVLLHIIKVLEQSADRPEAPWSVSEETPQETPESSEDQVLADGEVQGGQSADEVPADTAKPEAGEKVASSPPKTPKSSNDRGLPSTARARRSRSLADNEEAPSPLRFRRCFSDGFQPPVQADQDDQEPKIQLPEREGREGAREAGGTSWSNARETGRSRSPTSKDDKRPLPGKRVREVVKQFERNAQPAPSSSAVPKVAARKAAAKKAAAKNEAASKKAAAKFS